MIKRYILPYIKTGECIYLTIALILIFALSSTNIVLLGGSIDELISSKYTHVVFIAYFVCKIALYFFQIVRINLREKISGKIKMEIRNVLMDHWINSEQDWYTRQDPGRYKQLMCDQLDELIQDILTFWEKAFEVMIGVITAGLITVGIDWRVALVMLLYYPFAVWFCINQGKGCLKTHKGRQETARSEIGMMNSLLQGIQEIITLRKQEKFFEKATEIYSTSKNAKNLHTNQVFKFNFSESTAKMIGYAIVFAVSLIGYSRGTISIGSIVIQLSFADMVFLELSQCNYLYDLYTSIRNYAKTIQDILEMPKQRYGKEDLPVRSAFSISFHDVGFMYGSEEIIQNLSFSVKAGDHIAIYGNSGEGKTTLLNMVSALLMPNEGSVSLDEFPIENLTHQTITQNVFTLFQYPYLFNDTVLENIRCGDEEVSDEDAAHALKMAGFKEEEIASTLSRTVGENGCLLSGGEKKRIALARCFVKKPSVLLLDEPTAMLDFETEEAVIRNLKNVFSEQTVLIVSHSPNIAKWIDQNYQIQRTKDYGTKIEPIY